MQTSFLFIANNIVHNNEQLKCTLLKKFFFFLILQLSPLNTNKFRKSFRLKKNTKNKKANHRQADRQTHHLKIKKLKLI